MAWDKRSGARAVGVLLAVLAFLLVPAADSLAGPVIAPHRAVYDLSLLRVSSGAAVADARGKLEFEWADACTAWTVNQRTRIEIIAADGRTVEFGWILSSFETKDGLTYRFFIRRLNADGTTEEVRGDARLDRPGGKGTATFISPAPREIALPKGTVFPSAHSVRLIEAAAAGDLPMWRVVFDGSGTDGLFGVNAAPSEALAPGADQAFKSELTQGQPSWRLNLAYFGMDETVAEPEHEQTLRLFANGVVGELVLDYGDFALRAELASLEALPSAGC